MDYGLPFSPDTLNAKAFANLMGLLEERELLPPNSIHRNFWLIKDVPAGTPVHAIASGRLERHRAINEMVNVNYDSMDRGRRSFHSHVRLSDTLKLGERVEKGQIIGTVHEYAAFSFENAYPATPADTVALFAQKARELGYFKHLERS